MIKFSKFVSYFTFAQIIINFLNLSLPASPLSPSASSRCSRDFICRLILNHGPGVCLQSRQDPNKAFPSDRRTKRKHKANREVKIDCQETLTFCRPDSSLVVVCLHSSWLPSNPRKLAVSWAWLRQFHRIGRRWHHQHFRFELARLSFLLLRLLQLLRDALF